ncbi:MAG TPA: hypothetical protein DCM45_00060 [Clostridiales bacterium]|nr:hypothetical protein [Clostridiales bacterium]
MMPESDLLDICGPGQPLLARTAIGTLLANLGQGWVPFDFNTFYAGLYPECTYTALTYTGSEFFLAGLDGGGCPHLFTSLLGGVWEMRSLSAVHPLLGTQQVSCEIIQILHDAEQNQTFLICRRGQLVTLSDCPKCIRICQVTTGELTGGRLEADQICLMKSDGTMLNLPIQDIAQLRVTFSFAQQHLQLNPGVIVDLRLPAEFAEKSLPGSIQVPMEGFYDWLSGQSPSRSLFFVCRTGLMADDAVRLARSQGFRQAWSLGGIRFSG